MTRLTITRLGQALGLVFAALYSLCVAWDGLFPGEAMRSVWADALPGFDWLSTGDFFLGLVEVYLYGWIFAVLFVPIWNALGVKSEEAKRINRAGRPAVRPAVRSGRARGRGQGRRRAAVARSA